MIKILIPLQNGCKPIYIINLTFNQVIRMNGKKHIKKKNIVVRVEKEIGKDLHTFNKDVDKYKKGIVKDSRIIIPDTAKRPARSYWNKKAFIIAFSISLTIVILILLMIQYPMLIKSPVPRFFMYSNTMMIPTLIVSLFSFPLKIVVSSLAYLIITFIAYFILIYLLIYYYSLLNNHKAKKGYMIGIIITYIIFVALSMIYLLKGFYG